VLTETFERTRAVLGEDRFVELGLAYLERFPSEAPAIERVGTRFAGYLAGLPEDIRPSLPVVDLARLEWARLEALLAADPAGTIDPSAFAGDDVGTRVPLLTPSLVLLRVERRALELYDENPVSPEEGAVPVAVFRRRFGVRHVVLGEEEACALALAREGATLDAICECFPEPGGVSRAAEALARFTKSRVLVALVALALGALASGCGESPSSDFPFETGATMKPGDDCLRCHSTGSDYPTAPSWTAAGTVFPRVDSPAADGVSGVTVVLSSAEGELLEELVTNSVGNFYTARALPEGFRVALEHAGARIEMPCPPPAGNCGACHSPPPLGEAHGRIYIPLGGTLDPRALDCETWTRAP
jgi:hypothetical protein